MKNWQKKEKNEKLTGKKTRREWTTKFGTQINESLTIYSLSKFRCCISIGYNRMLSCDDVFLLQHLFFFKFRHNTQTPVPKPSTQRPSCILSLCARIHLLENERVCVCTAAFCATVSVVILPMYNSFFVYISLLFLMYACLSVVSRMSPLLLLLLPLCMWLCVFSLSFSRRLFSFTMRCVCFFFSSLIVPFSQWVAFVRGGLYKTATFLFRWFLSNSKNSVWSSSGNCELIVSEWVWSKYNRDTNKKFSLISKKIIPKKGQTCLCFFLSRTNFKKRQKKS